MLNYRSNYLYLVFASPLINEFEQINASFQHTNADQCRLFKNLNIFLRHWEADFFFFLTSWPVAPVGFLQGPGGLP